MCLHDNPKKCLNIETVLKTTLHVENHSMQPWLIIKLIALWKSNIIINGSY